jgi:hypothetical protein
MLEPAFKTNDFARAEHAVALYFCVRIGVRGDANCVSGRARYLACSNPKNFLTLFKKRKGVQGEATKKLKGNFWFARHCDLSKSSFKSPSP